MAPPVERTPLPNPQFYILLYIRFIEPVSFTLIFPFVYFMVRDFNITDNEKEIAFYAGFISSAFAVGEFFSGVPWGMLSDRIGRKPVIISGLFGTMITMFAFGLSKSLTWAIATRFLSGALNGNVGVLKSMVGEMTDRSNRALGFSYMAMLYSMGLIFGPALGGFLTHPVKKFPYFFNGNAFLAKYPYFLPCAICCCLDLVGIIFAYAYLEETLNKQVVKSNAESTPSLLDPGSSDSAIYGSISTTGPSKKSSSVNLSDESNVNESSSISKTTWYVITSYMALSLLLVMLDELFPFWAATSIKFGGLGYGSSDIGSVSSLMGIFLVFVQLFFYPSLQQKFSTLNLSKFAYMLFFPVICSLPIVSLLVSGGFTRLAWCVLIFLMALRFFCTVLAITSNNILLPESCASKNVLGKVNGISQALGSLMRGIGPSLCGTLWSWSLSNGFSYPFDYHLTFYIIASFSIVTLFLVKRIKPEALIH